MANEDYGYKQLRFIKDNIGAKGFAEICRMAQDRDLRKATAVQNEISVTL